jgi:hypothetical protein
MSRLDECGESRASGAAGVQPNCSDGIEVAPGLNDRRLQVVAVADRFVGEENRLGHRSTGDTGGTEGGVGGVEGTRIGGNLGGAHRIGQKGAEADQAHSGEDSHQCDDSPPTPGRE